MLRFATFLLNLQVPAPRIMTMSGVAQGCRMIAVIVAATVLLGCVAVAMAVGVVLAEKVVKATPSRRTLQVTFSDGSSPFRLTTRRSLAVNTCFDWKATSPCRP